MANLVLHMYAAANTVMTVNRILIFPILVLQLVSTKRMFCSVIPQPFLVWDVLVVCAGSISKCRSPKVFAVNLVHGKFPEWIKNNKEFDQLAVVQRQEFGIQDGGFTRITDLSRYIPHGEKERKRTLVHKN